MVISNIGTTHKKGKKRKKNPPHQKNPNKKREEKYLHIHNTLWMAVFVSLGFICYVFSYFTFLKFFL